jgi:hypothetical protein
MQENPCYVEAGLFLKKLVDARKCGDVRPVYVRSADDLHYKSYKSLVILT